MADKLESLKADKLESRLLSITLDLLMKMSLIDVALLKIAPAKSYCLFCSLAAHLSAIAFFKGIVHIGAFLSDAGFRHLLLFYSKVWHVL